MAANKGRVLAVLGPTCTGKSALAERLAETLGGEIINADSMQVYRYFDIGTAKPSSSTQTRIRHHLIDIAAPCDHFDVADFKKLADTAIEDIWSRGRLPIIVGGSGLYLKVLFHGIFPIPRDEAVRTHIRQRYAQDPIATFEELRKIDPEYCLRISYRDKVRVVRALEIFHVSGKTMSDWEMAHGFRAERYRVLRIGLMRDRRDLYERINRRVEEMFESGWVEEVKHILSAGHDSSCKPFSGIGYRDILLFLQGALGYADMVSRIKQETRRYAKRQLTWFLKADAGSVSWFRYPEDQTEIFEQVQTFLQTPI